MNVFQALLLTKISDVPISLRELINLKKIKGDFDKMIRSLIVINKARLRLDREQLIEHWRNGGDPENVVYGILTASKNGVSLSLNDAFNRDLEGIDIPQEYIKQEK
jgi:uncharacterized protein YqfA (UPF0365 family)